MNNDTGGRVSFYAFRDDSLYQTGQTNQQGQEHSNQISRDAAIVSETLLSATVHDVDDGNLSDLEENITISFQRKKVIGLVCDCSNTSVSYVEINCYIIKKLPIEKNFTGTHT